MIDPGHPFSKPYQELIASLEDSIRNGVEQPDRKSFIFKSAVTAYELPRVADAITRVTGMAGRSFTIFQPGVDFRFSNNRIVWDLGNAQPDESSRFEVEYAYRVQPAGLTDFNPGSVIGTLVRAAAREMKLIYEQMDQAYRRAFIDQASGVALDSVVALLGVARNPAIKAEGNVTFFRKKATTQDVTIPLNTRVADESGRIFVATAEAILVAEAVEFRVQSNGVLKVTNKIAELVGIRRRDDPDTAAPFATKDTAKNFPFGEDERTITLADGVRPAGELRIRYKSKSVTVPVEAAEAGPEGNVNAGAIVIMPTPPTGADGVINEAPIEFGQNAEPDDQLRERAKHALERAGNATLNAIKFAVLDVDGVEGVEVVDHSVDEAIPLGEVRVRFSGGDMDEVKRVVEQTRAAGISARLDLITKILISGTFHVIPDLTAPASATDDFKAAVSEAIEVLTIGEALSVRRLNALVYKTPGLVDMAEAQLRFKKLVTGPAVEGDVTEPFLIDRAELLRPDKANLSVKLLGALKATNVTPKGFPHQIDVQLLDAAKAAVRFMSLSIDINCTLRAALKTTPDLPERIGGFTRKLAFTNSATAKLTITTGDLIAGLNLASYKMDRVEVTISAAAYPALKLPEAIMIDLS